MTKKVLDVGNCGPDHATVSSYLGSHFDCEVRQAHGADDALEALRSEDYDLVVVNRKLDRDYSDGIEVIKAIKGDQRLSAVPVMLITNMPEHQDAAEQAGALRGFGKLEYDKPETLERLSAVLG